MISQRFFLSHFSGDKEIADIISSILSRVSLNSILPWFSSDSSYGGGLKPGDIWFNQILNKIQESSSLVAIITPNSINRPWLYFESGIAQSLDNCEVIPVCIGISKDKVYPPLGLFQVYQLSDYRSLKEFVGKLLEKFNIKFDEEAYKPILEQKLHELTSIKFDELPEDPKIRELINDFKSHVDKRFLEIWERPNLTILNSDIISSGDINIKSITTEQESISVTLQVDILFEDYQFEQFIQIREFDTFGDIISSIYFILSDYLKPYSYLETWALRDKETGKLFIIREIGDFIPAKLIFKNMKIVEVIKLAKPYIATDSKERVKL